MPTTVHIPEQLLERADAQAKSLGISRNRLIIEALEARLAAEDRWPEELTRTLLAPVSDELKTSVDELDEAIRGSRRNRKPRPVP